MRVTQYTARERNLSVNIYYECEAFESLAV